MYLGDTGYCNDGSDLSFSYFDLLKSVELIELANLGLDQLIGIVVVTDYNFLINLN